MEIDALETALPVKRLKKKRMADELINDEGNSSDSLADFWVNGLHCSVTWIMLCTTHSCIKIYPAWTQQSLKLLQRWNLKMKHWEVLLFPQVNKDQVNLVCFLLVQTLISLSYYLIMVEIWVPVATNVKFEALAHCVY